jgi:beta-RFAP synthase
MIRVVTGSRLHFGLFHLPADEQEWWEDQHGKPRLPARRYGGVGMMIEAPGVQLTASPHEKWSAEGPLAERALAVAQRIAESFPATTCPCHLRIERCAPQHAGLGTGTQFGLAIARAVTAITATGQPNVEELARHLERGARSALGIHGFAQGGVLVEAGQRAPGAMAPLIYRAAFPEKWRILLILPRAVLGLHGEAERRAFAQLPPTPTTCTDALCRLTLLGILPALQEGDLAAFGEALHDFNARVGQAFAPVQGGTYSSPVAAQVIEFLRSEGVYGVGQSSWGPAVFAIFENEKHAQQMASQVRSRLAETVADVLVTRGRNQGATCETG